ncbi:type II toxin-antitoxin system RelE/ParE family toxin [Rheinheimera sediminis]|uniref:type II toxin-antitoxin system RelE/ParE family toxin n=1 Tax=Rheinheimera sp. YQF-1 TaxID=2499626 RepID=UPI000FDA82CC|nr:type II toxin-antitoxin system RelE/ParE family toxin [Rheinheimera sp. YQF-1]
MTAKLLIRAAAKQDIQDAFHYYQSCLPNLGHEFLLCVDAQLHAIQRMPKRYRLVYKVIRRAVVRRFPYCIYFIETEQAISIIAVLHARRAPDSWQLRQ